MATLEELRTLATKAAPGPWTRRTLGHVDSSGAAATAYDTVKLLDNSDLTLLENGINTIAITGNGPKQIDNAEFISASVEFVRYLLDEVKEGEILYAGEYVGDEVEALPIASAYIYLQRI